MLAIAAATILALASSAAAHGGVTGIVINGQDYTGWQPYNAAQGQVSAERPYSSYNPILNATDPTIHCNNDGTPGPSQQTITVAAGANVTVTYTQWTHLPGPYQVYLAACPSSGCSTLNTGSLSWFKINEMGLISGTWANGSWANGILFNTLQWTAQIPTNLQPGNYMSRWETIAIHQANTPQFYPECVQFQVTGSGTAFPPSSYIVNFPGAYSMSDPGLDIDIYSQDAETETTYLIPGPRVWPGFNIPPPANLPGGSTSPSSPANPTTPVTTPVTTPTTTSTTTTTTTTTTTSTPPPASTGTVAKYGQCGGQGYTGPTTCAAGSTCTVSNPYYSQCL